WGTCEANVGASGMAAEHTLFLQAASQGQSVIAAAGDAGSTDCNSQTSTVAVDDPANQPQVLGVGGTTDTPTGEHVWNSGGTGSGGGISRTFCMPSYQLQSSPAGIINTYSVHNAACTDAGSVQYMRQVPDVAAVADPNTGYIVLFAGAWSVFGGTSAAAPLWAAIAALVDVSPFCTAYGSDNPGVQPSLLYQAANVTGGWSSMFTDVTVGNNDAKGTVHGKYPATTGFDLASGLGVPIVVGLNGSKSPDLGYPGLAARMCFQAATTNTTPTITSIHPTSIKPGTATSVTVTGSGFLPVTGATRVHLSPSVIVTATCSSTTSCTVPVPSLTTGTYDLTFEVERLASSTPGPSSALSVTLRTTTSTTPLISPLSTVFGTSTTLSADVTPSAATGMVTFTSGATTLCSAAISGGSASCASPTSAGVGSYDVLATYSGDGTYASSNANAGTYAVNKATATLAASASPSTVVYGRTSTFSVAGLRHGSSGSVTYSIGVDNLCTAAVSAGAASCKGLLTTPIGSVTVTAYYSGDTNDESASTTVDLTVSKASGSLKLTLPPRFPAEGIVVLAATVSPTATSGKVTFTIGGRAACSASVVASSAHCSSGVNLSLGKTSVVGTYSGSANVGPGSVAVPVTVTAGATPFVVRATPVIVALRHAPLLLASGFTKTTTGTVTFKVGKVTLCSARVVSGTARCSPRPMTKKGRVVVAASYPGDLRHRASVATTSFTVR
ncbi:MAG: Ig-like domain repeat protein, partial [Actinomycetota bacterium]